MTPSRHRASAIGRPTAIGRKRDYGWPPGCAPGCETRAWQTDPGSPGARRDHGCGPGREQCFTSPTSLLEPTAIGRTACVSSTSPIRRAPRGAAACPCRILPLMQRWWGPMPTSRVTGVAYRSCTLAVRESRRGHPPVLLVHPGPPSPSPTQTPTLTPTATVTDTPTATPTFTATPTCHADARGRLARAAIPAHGDVGFPFVATGTREVCPR